MGVLKLFPGRGEGGLGGETPRSLTLQLGLDFLNTL